MQNGNVLKIAFLMIIGTLCSLLFTLTLGAAFFHMPIDEYARLLGMLGIIGLFGGVVQAYIHSNIAEKASMALQAPINASSPIVAQIKANPEEVK